MYKISAEGKYSMRKHVLFIVENQWIPNDKRVWSEARLLNSIGYKVSIISPKDKHARKAFENIDGIDIIRHPTINLGNGIIGFILEYGNALIWEIIISFIIYCRDRFDIIHAANPPDDLFVIGLLYKIVGVKFIYDHHDLSPELYLAKYRNKKNIIYNILLIMEELSCKIADVIIATNTSYKNIEIERDKVNAEKIFIVRYGPNLEIMKRKEEIELIRAIYKTVLCYLGSINIQDGVDISLNVLANLVHKYGITDTCLLIIGDGDYLEEIKKIANKLKVEEYVIFTGFVRQANELNRLLSTADIFVDTAPYSFLNDNSTFMKIMEYLIYERPIVSFALKESMFSIGEAGVFVTPNDTDEMARVIVGLIRDESMRRRFALNAKKRANELKWEEVSGPLVEAYQWLNDK